LLSVVAQAFAFVVFHFVCVQVRIFLFLPVILMRAISGRSRLIRASFLLGLTGVGRPRSPTLFYGEEFVLIVRHNAFAKL
jgi:hypothetical protein